jgi:hypothetical protein
MKMFIGRVATGAALFAAFVVIIGAVSCLPSNVTCTPGQDVGYFGAITITYVGAMFIAVVMLWLVHLPFRGRYQDIVGWRRVLLATVMGVGIACPFIVLIALGSVFPMSESAELVAALIFAGFAAAFVTLSKG